MLSRTVTFRTVGKREVLRFLVLLAALALLALAALYLRSQGYGPRLGATQVPGAGPPAAEEEGRGVMAGLVPGASVADARMERERVRAQQMELLEKIVSAPDTAPETRQRAEEQMLALITAMGREAEIEGILRSKGYREVVAYVREGAVTVVVAQALEARDATRIAEAVCRVTGCRPEQVAIVAPPAAP